MERHSIGLREILFYERIPMQIERHSILSKEFGFVEWNSII